MRRNKKENPIKIISHRGASGHRPEHTLASYELGARHGGDFIEMDLVATKDGRLICRHESEIGETTDVADRPEFADRRTTRTIDGREITGFFAQDFTLAEIKTLRARERLQDVRTMNAMMDGTYEVPTLEEVIDLAFSLTAELKRPIGIYPETKHPSYHVSQGLELEPPLIAALKAAGLTGPEPRVPVFLQSFEAESLRKLAETGSPLVFLLGTEEHWRHYTTPDGLAEVASFAHAIGPAKTLIVPLGEDGDPVEPTTLVDDAHEAGLLVHPYTFRSENHFLPGPLRSDGGPGDYGSFAAEYELFFELGVDGVFTDFSRHAFLVREHFLDTAQAAQNGQGGGGGDD
ncbi:glycerophosphodiester phosphodiesterase family protein [Nocardiopsis lambiniae]|uniref:glycerophosphodiester phosphodiesterase n=1 Tax=Nocardiopsis lambiniae TaxID=3075539 RepID=A0ABU2M9M0_9ACTN|nr:glycerophosphodiester phosphodiesterase family protein [Nocardiopsis sp. DSM 44743]MDT0328946.1 glycerophosphodiester phosphodiesterase family protein [Nocardiopsis sp. DSM 44743]